ncbi:MAG: tagaturonate reductase, partial [Defluviitaleaceae bacterium]|nr:tagaturonate reductase [Defluviitaleaceae bacterium]
AVIKPIPRGNLEAFCAQGNRYHVNFRGAHKGAAVDEIRLIECIQSAVDPYENYDEYISLARLPELRFVVSNTTEAGIEFDPSCRLADMPPTSFPGKLAQFLYRRYLLFEGDPSNGLVMLPVELIDENGKKLRECVLKYAEAWRLEENFINWIDEACVFCRTLVDRIVTGYPNDGDKIQSRLPWNDKLLDVAEPFGLWVIEGGGKIAGELPIGGAGVEVIFTDDLRPYRERKVRVLNGAHTAVVLAGFLCGKGTVGEIMADHALKNYLERAVSDEILPFIKIPEAEGETQSKELAAAYADSVYERFENPFVRHECLSIALNSVSKWKARILPSLRDFYEARGRLPKRLVFSLSALLAFYKPVEFKDGTYLGIRSGEPYQIKDVPEALEFFYARADRNALAPFVEAALARTDFWGEDLTKYTGLAESITNYLSDIETLGMRGAIIRLNGGSS